MQLTFGDTQELFKSKSKSKRREVFLHAMNQVVSWKQLLALIAPFYPKAGRPRCQPDALETLLRIHFLQQCYALSDPAMEKENTAVSAGLAA